MPSSYVGMTSLESVSRSVIERGERHACALGGLARCARKLGEVAELVLGVEGGGLDLRDLARETLALLGDGGKLQRIGCGRRRRPQYRARARRVRL